MPFVLLQAPPGWGEGLAFLFLAMVFLAVAPSVLMMVIGGVAGAVIPNTRIGKGVGIGLLIGIVDTIALFAFVFLLVSELDASLEWLDVGLPHMLAIIAVFVALGVAATIWVTWKTREH